MRSCLEPNAVLGVILVLKRWGKFCFPTFHQRLPAAEQRWEIIRWNCVFSNWFFFLASFEQNSPFQGEVSSTNTAQPSMYAPINALSNTARIKTIPAGTFTPNPDERQHGKWLHTFLPKLQLINIQLSSMTNVLQPPVGVHGIKGAAFLPARAQADPSPACWRRQWDGCARCSSKKPFYSQRTGNKGR